MVWVRPPAVWPEPVIRTETSHVYRLKDPDPWAFFDAETYKDPGSEKLPTPGSRLSNLAEMAKGPPTESRGFCACLGC